MPASAALSVRIVDLEEFQELLNALAVVIVTVEEQGVLTRSSTGYQRLKRALHELGVDVDATSKS